MKHWNVLSVDWDYFLPVFPYDPQLWLMHSGARRRKERNEATDQQDGLDAARRIE